MSKKIKLFAALMTAMALFATGTFAWQKVIEKNNEFIGSNKDVTVHDDFDPDTGLKDVYVENRGNTTVYVRVKLDETMNLGSYTWRPGSGDWVTHTHGATPENCEHTNLKDHKYFHDYFKWTMGGWKYYMPGSGSQSVAQDKNKYDGTEPGVQKTPDAKIVTSAQFLAMTEAEQKAFVGWIYATDGYAYWSQPLEKGEATGLLLHGVEALATLKDLDYYYAINVSVEVVDQKDVPMWTQGAKAADGSGATQQEASPDGKDVIHIITGSAKDEGSNELPVNKPADGFLSDMTLGNIDGNGFFAKHDYDDPDNTDPNFNKIYHIGSIRLSDVITDGNYNGVTAAAVDDKYKPYITIDDNQHGERSILYSYLPTKEEYEYRYFTLGDKDAAMPVEVKLTRDDGKTATITIQMTYRGCMFSWFS